MMIGLIITKDKLEKNCEPRWCYIWWLVGSGLKICVSVLCIEIYLLRMCLLRTVCTHVCAHDVPSKTSAQKRSVERSADAVMRRRGNLGKGSPITNCIYN